MRSKRAFIFAVAALGGLAPAFAHAEMLAMLNYETLAKESLQSLQLQSRPGERREGIAIIELDPNSADYGKMLTDIPVPPDFVLHHIFYNRDLTKAYVTALQEPALHVIDLTRFPYRMKPIPTPDCNTQEDIIFSDDNKTWYLTCMGSENVIMGDAVNDRPIKTITVPHSYPHGIALNGGIDRILVTSCVSPDLGKAGETIEVIKASTGAHLGRVPVSDKPGAAPVETVFVPHTDPPVAYVTDMMADTLWAAVWNPASGNFETQKIFDFATLDAHMPLEMYFNRAVDRLYVTTADPGAFHIFDISAGPLAPKLLKTLPTAAGAHHVALTPDERFAYVQNSLLNLPGLSDGSITVIDLDRQAVVDSIDLFKSLGLTPNSITLLPQWYHPAGHFNNGPG